jgi:transketolase
LNSTSRTSRRVFRPNLGGTVRRNENAGMKTTAIADRRSSEVARDDLERLCINTIRTLSIDMVQHANSEHPGMPLGSATMAYVLWTRHLRHNPKNPDWPDRDRFVLSAGHATALLYSLLFLTGYDLTREDLEQFGQSKSRTPGHPEHGRTPGVEVTSGPPGQGFANAVGFAIAERWLAATFNRDHDEIVDHRTYVLASDGDLMEGVAAEAASLAGTLRLGRVIVLYDTNSIAPSATTDLTFSEDVGARFEAYGWHVQRIDGQDPIAVDAALSMARATGDRPWLIVARTHIGYGNPNKRDTWHAHGESLGVDEMRATKRALESSEDLGFYVPADVLAEFRRAVAAGSALEAAWWRRVGGPPNLPPGSRRRLCARARRPTPGRLGGAPAALHRSRQRDGHSWRLTNDHQCTGRRRDEHGRWFGGSQSLDAHGDEESG